MALDRLVIEFSARGQRAVQRAVDGVRVNILKLQARQRVFNSELAQLPAGSKAFNRMSGAISRTALNLKIAKAEMRDLNLATKSIGRSFRPWERVKDLVGGVGRAFALLRRAVFTAVAVIVGGGIAKEIGQMGITFAKLGGDVIATREVFDGFTQKIGETAQDFLPRLRDATLNTISDLDLMKLTNFALNSGLQVSGEQFEKLAEGAVKLGLATGRDATEGLRRLTFGIIKQERRILDELGIIVDFDKAQRDAADARGQNVKEMTREEKVAVNLQEVLIGVNQRVKNLSLSQIELATAGQRLETRFKNFKDDLAEIFVRSGAAENVLAVLEDALTGVATFFSDPKQVANFFNTMLQGLTTVVALALKLAQVLVGLLPVFNAILDIVNGILSIIPAELLPTLIGAAIGAATGGPIGALIGAGVGTAATIFGESGGFGSGSATTPDQVAGAIENSLGDLIVNNSNGLDDRLKQVERRLQNRLSSGGLDALERR